MRKLLTTEGIHHPKADVNKLDIKIRNGGSVKLESAYNAAIIGLSKYINLLKTKRNLLCKRNQSVPRSKHFPPQL